MTQGRTYLITECVPAGKTCQRITLNEELSFRVYNSEARQYHLKKEGLLSEESFQQLMKTISGRGLSRALYLVKERDYTTHTLGTKLEKSGYPLPVIEGIIQKLVQEGLLNDRRYAVHYIISHMKKSSRKKLFYELRNRGIHQELACRAFEEAAEFCNETEAELEAAVAALHRKIKERTDFSYEEKMKIFAYMGRKGYEYAVIRQAWDKLTAETKDSFSDSGKAFFIPEL